jgi:hypothetical protein
LLSRAASSLNAGANTARHSAVSTRPLPTSNGSSRSPTRLDQGHPDTAGWQVEQLEQAGQVADDRKVGADVALAAVADARLVVERGRQHDR